METRAAAETVAERALDLLADDLSADRVARARAELVRWIEGWITKLAPENDDALRQLAEDVLPLEVEQQFATVEPADRYAFAVTAYDRWRARSLSEQTYERALAYVDQPALGDEAKSAAEADLAELREIESRLSEEFPGPYASVRRELSEGKLDSYYVLRAGGATSLRLGQTLSRRERA